MAVQINTVVTKMIKARAKMLKRKNWFFKVWQDELRVVEELPHFSHREGVRDRTSSGITKKKKSLTGKWYSGGCLKWSLIFLIIGLYDQT